MAVALADAIQYSAAIRKDSDECQGVSSLYVLFGTPQSSSDGEDFGVSTTAYGVRSKVMTSRLKSTILEPYNTSAQEAVSIKAIDPVDLRGPRLQKSFNVLQARYVFESGMIIFRNNDFAGKRRAWAKDGVAHASQSGSSLLFAFLAPGPHRLQNSRVYNLS